MNRRIILFICLVNCFGAIGFSQSTYQDDKELPEGGKGKLISNFIDAYNTFDKTAFSDFVRKDFSQKFLDHYSIESHAKYCTEYQHYLGQYTFECIRNYQENKDANSQYFLVKNHHFGSFIEFKIICDSLENKIDNLSYSVFEPAIKPDYYGEPNLTESEFLDSAKALIASALKNDAFSGTVLIARKDSILFEFATGEASKSFHALNRIDTKINLGSMNKMFTATAVLKLAESGQLQLHDTISNYLDASWLDSSLIEKITIHQLLTHTSGLGNFFNDAFINGSRELFRDVDDFKALIRGDTLRFEPGSQFEYSNMGYVLLGAIIEKVSGMTYFDYMQETIFLPLGMIDTDCYDMDVPTENLAIGYFLEPGEEAKWKNNLFMHVIKGGPAGGGFSTVKDLHKFAVALLQDRILSRESVELLWSPHNSAGRFGQNLGYENYGYGTMIAKQNNKQAIGHLGGFPGISAGLTVFPHNNYIVCVLSNYDHAGIILSNHLKRLIFAMQ